jgi:hypothetical protein
MSGKKTIVRGKVAKPAYSTIEQINREAEKRERKDQHLTLLDGSKIFIGSSRNYMFRQFIIGFLIAVLCAYISKTQWSLLGNVFLKKPFIVQAILGFQWCFIPIGFMAMFSHSEIAIGIAAFLYPFIVTISTYGFSVFSFSVNMIGDIVTNLGYGLGATFLSIHISHDTSARLYVKTLKALPVIFISMVPCLVIGEVLMCTWDLIVLRLCAILPYIRISLGMIVGMVLAHFYAARKRRNGYV